MTATQYTSQDVERFMQRVGELDANGCRNWQGSIDKANGYGWFWAQGKNRMAHRVSWEMHRGPVPDGCVLLHRCDNRPCVNPDHLTPDTQAENMADKTRKGRQTKGDQVNTARLTVEQVREIRVLYATGQTSTYKLGRQYGVSAAMIGNIVARRSWKDVE